VSETPRTDAAYSIYDLRKVAQDIERELNAANDRIKRLEEALTEIELAMKQPASNHRLMQIAGPARQALNIVKQAKEANP
jgi:hypothetical protein